MQPGNLIIVNEVDCPQSDLIAVYMDGCTRNWQQHTPFNCEMSIKAIRKIQTLQNQGTEVS